MTRKANPELPIRILEQAQQVVERLGHAGLNMRDLADRVGISATAIYHYYESKEQMMVQLKLRAAELLNARIRAIDLEGDPMEALHRLGEEYLAFAEENPNLYTLLFETQVGERPYSESEQPVLYFTYYTARNLLRRVAEGGALLTGLTTEKVLRTAKIAGVTVIVFVRGKKPSDSLLELARSYALPVMTTKYSLFVASGRLYMNGLRGMDGSW